MEKKRQHYIPRSYLQAWCDPTTPKGQNPYVWVFPLDGGPPKRKAPENLFVETDFYTIQTQDGERDLTIEDNLSQLEGEFASLKRDRFDKRSASFSSKQRLILCMFTMAMYGRTKAYSEHWSDQWQKALEMAEEMQRAFEVMSPEQRQHAASLTRDASAGSVGEPLTLEDVREMVEHPIQNSINQLVVDLSPTLYTFPFNILEAAGSETFITSDNPCVWHDPAGGSGLLSPTIEISLPVSPKHLILFGHRMIANGRYVRVKKEIVTQMNKRIKAYAHSYYVSSSKLTLEQRVFLP